jgi:hypothetical protein
MSDGVLQIRSDGFYRDIDRGQHCTEDCRRMSAQCQTPLLPAGTYTVRHGNDELVISVPSSLTKIQCIGAPAKR